MSIVKLGMAGLLAVSAAALGGCVDDYGYGGPAVGYGPGYAGYDGYYDGFYGDNGYYPGYYGWYGGYYYPGSGVYVYDRFRHPIRWNGDQRRYWQGQWHGYRGTPGVATQGFRRNPNWGGFDRGAGSGGRPPAGQSFRGGAPGAGVHSFGGGPGRGGGRHR